MSGAVRAAKGGHGFRQWWAQRMSAIALVPLSLWLAWSALGHAAGDRAAIKAWLADPVSAILMILTVAAGLHHAVLGIEEVVVDYVHGTAARVAALILLRLAGAALFAIGVFAVLRIALGG